MNPWRQKFPAGPMGPKVEAASRFAAASGKRALIGALVGDLDFFQSIAFVHLAADLGARL